MSHPVPDPESIFEAQAIAAYESTGAKKPWAYLSPTEHGKWRTVVLAVERVGKPAREAWQAAQPNGMAELLEIKRVTMFVGGDWPDLETESQTVRHVKWMARQINEVAAQPRTLDAPVSDESIKAIWDSIKPQGDQTGRKFALAFAHKLLEAFAAGRAPVAQTEPLQIPEGWKLLPSKLTPAMIAAWAGTSVTGSEVAGLSDDAANTLVAQNDWDAMLSAAPTLPSQIAAPVAPIPALPYTPPTTAHDYVFAELAAAHAQNSESIGRNWQPVTPPVAQAEPMFWVRLRSDGGYEGPLHNDSIEAVRKNSGAWTALFPHSIKDADSRDAGRYRFLKSEAYEAVIPFGGKIDGSRAAWITKFHPGADFDEAIDAAIQAKDATP